MDPVTDTTEAPEPPQAGAPAPRRLRLAAVLDVAAVVVAVIVGLASAVNIASTTVQVGPVTLNARMGFGWPAQTSIHVPPFGSAHAQTHAGPARLVVTVANVDIPAIEQLLAMPRPIAPEQGAVPEIRRRADEANTSVTDLLARETRSAGDELVALVLVTAGLAAITAGVVAAALRRKWRLVSIAAVAAATLVAGSAVLGAATYRHQAFAEPRLEGALSYVPQLETIFAARLGQIEALRDQAAVVANNLAAYYADPRSIVAGGGLPDTYRVLHVTDLHLDPVGAQLGDSLARAYDVSLVINTGDIAILGGAEESALLRSLVTTAAPVVYVPGNHDSPLVNSTLDAIDNVSVVTTGTVVVDGLRIFAMPDPQSTVFDFQPVSAGDMGRYAQAALSRLQGELDAGLPTPDIVALHDPRGERDFFGMVPLILSGHTHSERLYVSDETVRLNSGTLGGMPYDPVISGRDRLPHSASILYYTPDIPRQLIAVDRISVLPDRTTTLTRHVVNESLLSQ